MTTKKSVYFSEEEVRVKKYIDICSNINTKFEGCVSFRVDKNDICVNFSPAYIYSRLFSVLANDEGAITVLYLDGILDFDNIFNNPKHKKLSYTPYIDVEEDYIFCFGKNAESYLSFLHPTKQVSRYVPKYIQEKTMNESESKEYDFLITTANTSYFNEEEKLRLVNLINLTITNLEKERYTVCLRVFDDCLLSLICGFRKYDNIIDKSFSQVLNNVRAVITTPSTVGVEAMINDVPVATLLYRDSPIINQTGWYIFGNSDHKKTFDSMNKRDKDRMQFQRYLVNEYLICDDNEKGKSINFDYTDGFKSKKNRKSNIYRDLLMSKYNINLKLMIKKVLLDYKRFIRWIKS
ncbi:hypothetical protein [Vibrio alginolyticus]|uniref:hypothetical protein n=1 Tax=Vibrio alginolyticus TaxID=663 RepID=UPI003754CBD1